MTEPMGADERQNGNSNNEDRLRDLAQEGPRRSQSSRRVASKPVAGK